MSLEREFNVVVVVVSADFKTLTVCEGQQMEIACQRHNRIVIMAATFGRTPNGSEECPPNKTGYIGE
jgi:hypothetical protein